jgi:mono/diheme cytochrome c family protein/glucose/arabinose dehydrogenase
MRLRRSGSPEGLRYVRSPEVRPYVRSAALQGCLIVAAAASFIAQSRPWPPPVQKVAAASPALSPADEHKTMFMPPGYRLELVASEPMIVDPIAIDFDPDGRLWAIEMLGFMPDTSGADSREPLGRIAVLEDVNDDGVMDRRTTFLDKLILPRAIKVLDRGVLIGEPPNLWLARDTDGDLKADTKELVRNDYGRLEGNPEHNANSLHWGIDNVIYTSEHTYHLELKNGTFRVQPAPSRGQWGVGSDDAGRIYRNWNEQPLFVDYIAPRYYARNPNLVRTRGLYDILMEPKDMLVWPVRPTPGVNRGYREGLRRPDGTISTYVSAGTPVIYRGDRLPNDLRGDAFVTESAGNLVHRLKIVDDGTGRLSARNAYAKGEFLASTDERFRPVNLFSAPDGTLYVVDMYRGVVQDGAYWTDYLRDYIKTHGLEAPVGLGRIWRVVHETTKRDRRPALSKASPAELVALLAHPNGWYRDTAQRLLVERGERSVTGALREMTASHADWRARLHALWTLDGIDAIDRETVEKSLRDRSPAIRAAAVRLAERWLGERSHPAKTAVLAMTNDPDWGVRRQLAASYGSLPREERLDAIASLLRRYGGDPVTVDAAISGLADQEWAMLELLLDGERSPGTAAVLADPVAMLAAAIARGRDAAAVARVREVAADATRPEWQRAALTRGIDAARPGAGRGRGSAGNAPLTPFEQKRFSAGQEIYKNLCVACHQPDGRGREKIAPALAGSRYVIGDPAIAMRIVLSGKEGPVGLMPPVAGLSDEQIAAVLTYIRREWGHTAAPVTAAEVREVRGMTASRKRPWTEEELAKLAAGRGGRGGFQ